jgi:hypothetical protein
MPLFNNITVVSLTGLKNARGAAHSVELCSRQMPGAQALLMSPERPANLPPAVRHRVVAPMNYHEYSWFVMFALWRFIETDYALIVQDDGWILDIANWRDEFLDYDYVGAPIHLARVDTPQDSTWMRSFSWYPHLDQADSIVMPVLNGGFSLRSKRMLRALIDHPEVRVEVPPPNVHETEPIKMGWFNDAINEDVQLTAVLRPQLERLGIRYAPLDVCARFAVEDAGPIHDSAGATRKFGQHGWWRRLISVDPPVMRYQVARRIIDKNNFESAFRTALMARGFGIEYADDPG